MSSILAAAGAALLLGGVMTAGDWIWAFFGLRHRMYTGIGHGALMCLFIGAIVGSRAGRLLPGLLAGPLIGVAAAASFYVLAPAMRYSAMIPAWMLFWILFAFLQRWLAGGSLAIAVLRGVAAASVSGVAFYAISGIWTRPSPGGPNYLVHFLYWSFAFLPGFLALFVGHTARPSSR